MNLYQIGADYLSALDLATDPESPIDLDLSLIHI